MKYINEEYSELDDEEKETCLGDISKYVYKNEEKGKALWQFIYEAKTKSVLPEIIREYIDRS